MWKTLGFSSSLTPFLSRHLSLSVTHAHACAYTCTHSTTYSLSLWHDALSCSRSFSCLCSCSHSRFYYFLHCSFPLSTGGGDRIQNDHDCQNRNNFSRESPKCQRTFHRVNGSPRQKPGKPLDLEIQTFKFDLLFEWCSLSCTCMRACALSLILSSSLSLFF